MIGKDNFSFGKSWILDVWLNWITLFFVEEMKDLHKHLVNIFHSKSLEFLNRKEK